MLFSVIYWWGQREGEEPHQNQPVKLTRIILLFTITTYKDYFTFYYCNSLLYGLPAHQIQKLQRVQNSAARLVFHESKFCHITPLLRALHWLPVAYRIVFKILLLTFKAIYKLAPTYISKLVSPRDSGGRILDQITANFFTFHHASLFPRSVINLFIWLPLNYGTIFPFLLEIYLQLMLSRRLLKLIYFRRRFPANLLFLFSLLRRICI